MATITWDHIHLRTADPEATVTWFEKMLGAEIIRSTVNGKPRIDMKLGGANIFIAPVAAGEKVNPAPQVPYQGLDHFGLLVSDIDEIVADLKKKGVQFIKEPHSPRPPSFMSMRGLPFTVLRVISAPSIFSNHVTVASGSAVRR